MANVQDGSPSVKRTCLEHNTTAVLCYYANHTMSRAHSFINGRYIVKLYTIQIYRGLFKPRPGKNLLQSESWISSYIYNNNCILLNYKLLTAFQT